ncbi:hypothetical protein ACVWWO_000072 [Bradyrhizobium sp. F1.13.1]
MVTIAPALLFSRYGIAALTSRTVPIMSVENSFSQLSSSCPIDSALTLATTMSMPPSLEAMSSTQALSAGPFETSTELPYAAMPLALIAVTAVSTSAWLRAQIPTSAPSAANVSAIALPIPLVLPVTRTFAPLSPRSMSIPSLLTT